MSSVLVKSLDEAWLDLQKARTRGAKDKQPRKSYKKHDIVNVDHPDPVWGKFSGRITHVSKKGDYVHVQQDGSDSAREVHIKHITEKTGEHTPPKQKRSKRRPMTPYGGYD